MTPINQRRENNQVDLDNVFRALSHTIRRHVLVSILEEHPRGQAEFEAMAFEAGATDAKTSRTALYHSHLPHLADAGFIVWDPGSGRIERGPRFEAIRPLLELLGTHRTELPSGWP